jgi:hypothetical protein
MIKVINIPGVPVDQTVVDHPTVVQQNIRRDGNRWRMVVELTWDVLPEDITEQYEGDAEVDFANRAFYRIRNVLNSIVGKGNPFAHFHILKRAHRCTELD